MVSAYHIIFGNYGFWLPNDPRGSWSKFVADYELYCFAGAATKTSNRRSLAKIQHDASVRRAAKRALLRPAVRFNGLQARAVARGFGAYLAKSKHKVLACCVMPDHVHVVATNLSMSAERFVVQLKSAAIRQLVAENRHPFQDEIDHRGLRPECFVRGQWIVYLKSYEIERAIRYVDDNPVRARLKRQKWSFVCSGTDVQIRTRTASAVAAKHGSRVPVQLKPQRCAR